MTAESIKFIFLFLVGTTLINFASAIVARLKTSHKEYNFLILYWVSLFITFGAAATLGANPTQIAFSYYFQFIPSIIITGMLRSSLGMPQRLKYFVAVYVGCAIASTYLLLATNIGFTASLIPMTLANTLPFIDLVWVTLVSKRKTVNWVEKVMGVMFATAIVNHINFSVFRLDDANAWWGWSVSFAQYQFLSIFLPLLISHRRDMNEKKNLQSALEKLSGNYEVSPTRADELYRELDFQIAQKEDFSNKLQLANARLEDEQEMNEMLIRTISHDLANPLTVVNAYVTMILNGKITAEEMPKINLRIKNNLDMATDMIDRIRNAIMTRTQNSLVSMKDVSVDDSINGLLEMFETRIRAKNLHVAYNNPHPGLMVRAERNMLTEHVLSNILSNAIKFSFENGTIKINVTEKEDTISIEVSDHGAGIEKKRLQQRLLASTCGTLGETGTGLGLMVMSYFVRKFEGNFQITSEGESKGTTVIITLKKSMPTVITPDNRVESAQLFS